MSSQTVTETAKPPQFGAFGVLPRNRRVVQAELTEAQTRFAELERVDTLYHQDRKLTVIMNDEIIKEWANKRPNMPLAPHKVPGVVALPPLGSPVGLEFYELHYTLERLDLELVAAKKVESGR